MTPKAKSRLVVINEQGEQQVVYEPHPHQERFHASAAPNLLALGPRGTAKSTMLRFDAHLRCLMIPHFRALLLRKTTPELRKSHLNFIDREMALLGGTFNHTTNVAKYPNGSELTFSHCATLADVMNYLSSEVGYLAFDELTTFTLDEFLLISAAARAPVDAPYTSVVRAGTNPLGPGADWVYQWFVDKTVKLEEFPDYNPEDFEVQVSTLEDNPSINAFEYRKRLKNLPEHVRRAWLLGERVIEGAYFTDFRPMKSGQPWHVVEEMPTVGGVPIDRAPWVRVYRAVDWGYSPDPAVCLWVAVLPDTRAIVFKERTWKKTLAADVAAEIKRESADMRIVETFADPTMEIKTGAQFAIGEIFEQHGVPLTYVTNDRILFGYAIHNYLNTLINEEPQIRMVKGVGPYGCPELIRTLPMLRMDPSHPARIAEGHDHWAIALAYFCMGQAGPGQLAQSPKAIPQWMQARRRPRLYAH